MSKTKKSAPKKAKADQDDQIYEMAREAASMVGLAGMSLPLAQYVDYLGTVIDLLRDMQKCSEGDLKRQEG